MESHQPPEVGPFHSDGMRDRRPVAVRRVRTIWPGLYVCELTPGMAVFIPHGWLVAPRTRCRASAAGGVDAVSVPVVAADARLKSY